MLYIFRLLAHSLEVLISVPMGLARWLAEWVFFNPRLGPLRHVAGAAAIYVVFALALVYVVAPLRGIAGNYLQPGKLTYDAERWLATAIYDVRGNFVGTFDARLDSRRDVNYTNTIIEHGGHVANPDHKSIPVREVPEHYWQCLVFHEDRHLGGLLNPFGIDLAGVLKIPVSTLRRSIARRKPSFGVGGSTLPMQLARVIYKTPPHLGESGLTKLGRKLSEWWLAPVIYRELTKDGSDRRLRQWAANHLWLAQRSGGPPLHGVEVTSRIVFGKEANALTVAEQFVLASAVNKPIILLEGSERLNVVRLDRWRYITEVRARHCAERLLADDEQKKQVLFELVNLAGGPPDPHVRPKLHAALEKFAPAVARRAEANPALRARALLPSARFGLREEMKQAYGTGWREHVRGVTTTLDATQNLAFEEKIRAVLKRIDTAQRLKIRPGFTLGPVDAYSDLKSPNVVVVAADSRGRIVRYYDAGETAAYFGAFSARDPETGLYDAERDGRMIASTGKILAAIAISNSGSDSLRSLYVDTQAPTRGLETCAKGNSRFGRKAIVTFACSLNAPLLNRAALAGQGRMARLIDRFGFNMPPRDATGAGTPASTAAVLGQISGSPRRVHRMSAVILAQLLNRVSKPVPLPSLVEGYDFTAKEDSGSADSGTSSIKPNAVIRRRATPLLKSLLEAPLCYASRGRSIGTLKSLKHWCAARRSDVRLHFAKTGTQVTTDRNATVDVWATGGLQFTNGKAYSYVVLVGTGSPSEPWGTKLHAAQVAAPLLEVLLKDLSAHANAKPVAALMRGKKL
jgi:penicillin-binding protein 1A